MTPEEFIKRVDILARLLDLKTTYVRPTDLYIDDPISFETYLNVWVTGNNMDVNIDSEWTAYAEMVDDPIETRNVVSLEEKFKLVEQALVDIRNKLNEHDT